MIVTEVAPSYTTDLRHMLLDSFSIAGSPSFGRVLFDGLRAASGCCHMGASSWEAGAPPRSIMSIAARPSAKVNDLVAQYLSEYWALDPLVDVINLARDQVSSPLIALIEAEDFPEEQHKAFFRDRLGLRTRHSLVYMAGSTCVCFSLYWRAEGPDQLWKDAFLDSADLIASTLGRHIDSSSRRSQEWTRPALMKRFRMAEPGLSQREAEVCAGIVMGFNSEAIALDLSISLGTVQEFRKRAYRKIGISSQNELMRVILTLI